MKAQAKRNLAKLAVVYVVFTAILVVVNVRTNGPSWWYFAAAGIGLAIVMHALRVRKMKQD